MKTFAITTLGCKVNQYESNSIKQSLIEKGYKNVSFLDYADIYIINTCTVTEMAAKKSKQITRRVRKINKDAYVVVTGCLAQNNALEIKEQTSANLVVGNSEKKDIANYIISNTDSVKDIMSVKTYDNMHISKSDERTRAYIKIQDGCVNFCTYCIIPYVRGPIRSRKIDDIEKEVKELVKNKVKEIVLTGIHLDSYGKDLKNISLIDVIKRINDIDGVKRIRLGSLEPTIINNQFIEQIKKLDKVCYQFHLSLQAGCDITLKNMNRKYTTKQFKSAALLIYNQLKEAAITTDIIVGFPGESEDHFNKSYDFVKGIGFLKVHVFKFSKRKGTKAYDMQNQIDGSVKNERSKKLIEMTSNLTEKYLEKYVGKILEVLTENIEEKHVKGHSKNYINISIKNTKLKLNEIYKVKIVKNNKTYLIGEVSEK